MTASERFAVVTGTSGGLGAAIARSLIEDSFTVIGIARRDVTSDDLGVAGNTYRHVQWDLSDLRSLRQLAATIVKQHGKPFALVNNAATGTDGLLPTMHDSEIEQVIRLNITSPIMLTKYLVRPMLSARNGRVVNISSIVARTGYRGLAAYGATKAALEGFTRSLARDVGPRNVTVNAVAPGFLATEMTASLGASNLDRIQQRAALKRFATTDEVAAAVSYLLSERAAGVTGTILTIDGGSSA